MLLKRSRTHGLICTMAIGDKPLYWPRSTWCMPLTFKVQTCAALALDMLASRTLSFIGRKEAYLGLFALVKVGSPQPNCQCVARCRRF